MPSRGFSTKRSRRQDVSNMRGVEKLQTAEFDERNIPPCQLDFERSTVMRGAEENRLLFKHAYPLSRFSSTHSAM